MTQFVESLAEKAGVRPEHAERGLSALLLSLQGRIPEETMKSIERLLPEIRELRPPEDQLDFWGSSLSGAGGGARPRNTSPLTSLMAQLSRAGLTLQEAQNFLPAAYQLMKKRFPPEIIRQIDRGVPGISNVGSPPPRLLTKLRNLF
jgi:hypothetical protein